MIPKFRDFKTGKFLFKDQIEVFKKQKIKEIYTFAFNKTHIAYLLKIGFVETEEQGKFRLLVQ
ncbi:MAG TPA: hypothetical protein DCE78_10905 [Bacteroidetes bacterium]|nr:hypothetical protein [Bacteroidota bacterium]